MTTNPKTKFLIKKIYFIILFFTLTSITAYFISGAKISNLLTPQKAVYFTVWENEALIKNETLKQLSHELAKPKHGNYVTYTPPTTLKISTTF